MSVSLSTGQSIRLERADEAGGPPVIRLDLGWLGAPRRGIFGSRRRDVELDASAVLFAGRTLADVVFFQHLVSNDGSVRHTGESESITVELSRVPPRITQIVFTVNSYVGPSFAEVQRFHCRLVDDASGAELASLTLSGGGEHRGQVLAKVARDPDGAWELTAIGVPAQGRTFREMLPAIEEHL
ncbi:TerD family protein [Streptacidiphilus pinicola]|uniref:TerD family protein n=1 Tax=Streptacidiphilus pinicola TaxID=2219663 RepID=A0A2X0ISX8_9ACTN|nr:TerD family protein [Streptacidiphilus pinicola]RAG86371.1 TerD family protein [Streptacidiphilus pinicola]